MDTTIDGNGIRTNAQGYVAEYGCSLNHSGNSGYVLHSGHVYACQGCGNFVTADEIKASIRADRVVANEERGYSPR